MQFEEFLSQKVADLMKCKNTLLISIILQTLCSGVIMLIQTYVVRLRQS